MKMFLQVALLALVAAEEGKDSQFPFMVPNWGKILGKQQPQAHHPQKKHKEKHIEVQTEVSTEARDFKVGKVEHVATEGKPLCKGREYVEGSWKLLAHTPPKTFKCCSWDEGPGYWKHDLAKCQGAGRKFHQGPSGAKFISIGGHGCMCDAQLDQVSKREMHVWQPSNCSLPSFNANKFCKALGNGKIHFFGDSQMQQAAATLMNMVIGGHAEESKHCAPQMTFHLSDYLIGAPDERGEIAEFDKYDADIYILGLGAWVHNRKKYADTLDIVAEKITKRQNQPNPPTFIWKTVSGAGCGPINKIAVDHHDPSYTYDLFPTYDAMAREKLEPLGVKFVDLSPLYLRGDAHPVGQRDCLHFCAPGPVDIFPRVLHHVLQEAI
eukprot:gnl/MRDRNA2_/MRDRNA2_86747_c0_seq11.p1 gnl/MRDRNA2_/MRDRNA2_86747_c0~~gnl/MRDRNA2_/MRDRNA2_86747_c0_seq11.p1  ORF type:complete len:380 (+),score=91.65 gnl/MRDRNA2_/MRDRNA2_86747_c0_seq11:73-1212(+)